ncbi:MAG TPA: type II toxin-antitoxin system VapC family toxin [Opitutaceae bacterium]|jgi:predicted nucleic acid-binding protein
MKALVIDGSTTIGFVLQGERGPEALKTLEALEAGTPIFVPAHWCTEVANGLIVAERRKRASQAEISEALALIAALPVETDPETALRAFGATAALARQYGLTVYDAAYLELAMRRGAALSTTDGLLMKAAKAAGVQIFPQNR